MEVRGLRILFSEQSISGEHQIPGRLGDFRGLEEPFRVYQFILKFTIRTISYSDVIFKIKLFYDVKQNNGLCTTYYEFFMLSYVTWLSSAISCQRIFFFIAKIICTRRKMFRMAIEFSKSYEKRWPDTNHLQIIGY